MKKSFKQIVSVIIAVFMVTALVPAYGFAADSGNAAQTQPATQADSSVAAEQPQTATAETQAAAPQTAAATADSLKLSVDGKTYTGWSNAMTAAATAKKKVVTLVSNGTLPAGQYVIPEGVTLLVPFDEKATLYTTEPECYLYYWSEPSAYRTLTLDAGAELVVNGALSVSAPHTPVMGYLENGGSPYSAYGQIAMKDGSSITVNHGGSLYAYGYITGDGAVKAKNGSVVYEYFQIMDFRGGSATTYLMDAKYKDENGNKTPYGIFPFSQYYVQNIEVPLTLEYGARECGYTSVYAARTVTPAKIGLIGPNDDTLFRVNSGSVTKQYDGKTDRIKVSVNGSASLDSIVVKSGDYTMNSADFVMPVNGNMTIEAASGTLNIAEDIALIPGAELIVAKDALCKLADGSRMFVYDNYHWGKYTNIYGEKFNDVNYAPGRTYTRTEANLIDAKVQVGGTLDAQGGFVYTTGKSTSAFGANICGMESGVIKLKSGKDTYTWQFEYVGDKSVDADYGNYHKINVANAKLKNSGGAYVNTEAGTYTYKDGKWSKDCVHSYVEYKAKDPTCTEPGWKAYKACKKCSDTTYVEIPALGHELVQCEAQAPSYNLDGWEAYEACTRCEYTTFKVVPATRHTLGEEKYQIPTAKADGGWYRICSECNEKIWTKPETLAEYLSRKTAETTITVKAKANQQKESITVSWTKNTDLKFNKYKVFRSVTGKAGSFVQIAETSAVNYADKNVTPGKTYYYYVTAVRTQNNESYVTTAYKQASAKVVKVTAGMVKATKMKATSEYAAKAIKLKWTSPNIKVDGYEIWRSNTAGGKYKLIKTTKSTARTWTNTGLKVNSRYYYKVRGYRVVNGKKAYTQFSAKGYRYVLNAKNAKLANAIEGSNAVTAKKATKVNGGIRITWSKKAAVKCNGYEIWRATSKNGKYTKLGTTKNKYYVDKSKKLKKGKRYYYKIVGFRWFGKACPLTNPSNVVSAVK